MERLLQIKPANDKEPVLIQSTKVEQSHIQQAHKADNLSVEEMLQQVKPLCESIVSNFQTLSVKPDSTSTEFGLNISTEGLLFIVGSAQEATFKVTLTWNNNKTKRK